MKTSTFIASLAACLLAANSVWAQGSSNLFSGAGATGSTGSSTASSAGRTTTGSMSASPTSGSTSSTQSSSSLFGSGSSGTSGSSTSGSSVSSSSQGGVTNLPAATLGTGGAPIDRNQAALTRTGQGPNIVGTNANIVGGQGGAANQRNQLQSLFSILGNQGNFNQSGRSANRPQVRIPMRLGFQPPPVIVPQYTATVQNRLANLPGLATVGTIDVSLQGTTMVLRGVVATEEDRLLAQNVAMLEPEVERVQNDLTVRTAGTASPETLPPPANR